MMWYRGLVVFAGLAGFSGILGLAGAQIPEPPEPPPSMMPGIEHLSTSDINLFYRMAQVLPSPCGKPHSLWEARNDPKCEVRARRALRYVKELVEVGDLALDIQEKYPLRYRCPRQKLNLTGVPSRGRGDATVTLVEFSDFECPRCKAAEPEIKRILGKYPQVKLVFLHYPLTKVHAYAEGAARAAVAAGIQGQFWPYHDAIYDSQKVLTDVVLRELALGLKLNLDRFSADLDKARAEVRRQRDIGDGLKVSGTPTFFVNGCKVQDGDVQKLEGWIEDELDLVGR